MMDKKKYVFILGNLPSVTPYLKYYTDILDENNIKYDIICWNRRGGHEVNSSNLYIYEKKTEDSYSPLKKILEIYGFYDFAINILRKKKYDFIYIFTISIAVYFWRYLLRYYNKRYVFDIRDYSPLFNNLLFRFIINKLLENSRLNCISSLGFTHWLPQRYKYVLSHNIGLSKLDLCYSVRNRIDKPISILTIGGIRDYASNSFVINSLGGDSDFKITFIGSGNTISLLNEYSIKNRYNNVFFGGKYLKKEEDDIVRKFDMINIFLPRNILSDFLMSNRFYLSVLHRKPMIVNGGSTQAYYVEKYNLGVIIHEGDDLAAKILLYCENFNFQDYNKGCIAFLNEVKSDLHLFAEFVESTL